MVDFSQINFSEEAEKRSEVEYIYRIADVKYAPVQKRYTFGERAGEPIGEPVMVWSEVQDVLSHFHKNSLGQRVQKVEQVDVTTPGGETKKSGSQFSLRVAGYKEAGSPVTTPDKLGEMIGKVFKAKIKVVTYPGLKKQDGTPRQFFVVVPFEQLPDNYVHPVSESELPRMNLPQFLDPTAGGRNPLDVYDSEGTTGGGATPRAAATEEDIDRKVAAILNGTEGKGTKVVLEANKDADLRAESILEQISSGKYAQTLVEKGLLKQDGNVFVAA